MYARRAAGPRCVLHPACVFLVALHLRPPPFLKCQFSPDETYRLSVFFARHRTHVFLPHEPHPTLRAALLLPARPIL